MIQERQEETGWLFKTRIAVRRVTLFVGKLWFKSGKSERKNYLQTPTAVCGVRGSALDWGFDSQQTFMNIYEGSADIVGNVFEQFFDDPGIDAATKNQVYQANASASAKFLTATTPRELAEARALAFQAIAVAGNLLRSNPDANIAREAAIAENVGNANQAAAEAEVAAEQLAEAGAPETDITAALNAAADAAVQAEVANNAAAAIYAPDGTLQAGALDQAVADTKQAADNAKAAAQPAKQLRDDAGVAAPATIALPATTIAPSTTASPPTTTPLPPDTSPPTTVYQQ
jgi:hypothetical protein